MKSNQNYRPGLDHIIIFRLERNWNDSIEKWKWTSRLKNLVFVTTVLIAVAALLKTMAWHCKRINDWIVHANLALWCNGLAFRSEKSWVHFPERSLAVKKIIFSMEKVHIWRSCTKRLGIIGRYLNINIDF